MMIPRFRTTGLVLIVALLAAPGAAAPGPSEGAAELLLTAPAPGFEPAEGGAGQTPVVAGFGRTSRPGEPVLPVRILLVAIPEGSVPELRILSAEPVLLNGLDLAPVPTLRVLDRRESAEGGFFDGRTAGSEGAGRAPRAAAALPESSLDFHRDGRIYERDAFFPEVPARLGNTGYLRDQRFVEVLFSPLLFNARRRQAQYFPRVRAEVRFSIPEPARTAGPFLTDPFFEDTYRASLANYEQGKLFRAANGPAVSSGSTAPLATETGGGVLPQAGSGGPRFKLLVTHSGIYRLDHAYLTQHAPDLLSLDPRTLSIEVDGVEVPISIRSTAGGAGESDGVFGTDDVLEFFGRPKTEPPTKLNYGFGTGFPDIYQANDFIDTQVYWLSAGGALGSHQRTPVTSGAPVGAFPLASDYQEVAVWEENNYFLPTGAEDPYYSSPSLLAGGASAQRDIVLSLPGIAPSAVPATVSFRIRGGSNPPQAPDHKVRVWVNGDTAEAFEWTWDGDIVIDKYFTVAYAALTNPSTLHVEALGLAGVALDVQYIDRLSITYRRQFVASGGALVFSYPNQDARFQVSGLGDVPPSIYDISRSVAGNGEADALLITGAVPGGTPTSNYTFEVPQDVSPSAPAVRTFALAVPGGYLVPDAVLPASDPVLAVPGQAADILVVGSAATLDTTPGGSLDLLLAHRLSAQGLTSRVIDIAQIYDEFGFGRRDPEAVRRFLGYAYDNWRGPSGTGAPPSFLLLVGDATPDYKNNQGLPDWIDQVPTPIMFQTNSIIGYYSSDNFLASFRGTDQIPDIHLGRISTRSTAAAAPVFDKIRLYGESPPPGLWNGRAMLVAGDGRSAEEAATFEAVQTGVANTYFHSPPYTSPSPPLYYAEPPWSTDAGIFKNELISELDGGSAIFSYVGHGAFDVIGLKTFFSSQDATALTNSPLLPLFVGFDCLAGGFHSFTANGSLGEAMTNNPAGGSIASLAPSGLSSALVGDILSDELFRPLFGTEKARVLGVVQHEMHAALWSMGMIGNAQSLTFLGDPATVFSTPAPPPPTGLTALGGNGQVTLDWSPPALPVAGYRVYRSAGSPYGPYVVACSPGAATSCIDTGVVNATRYYYYAVSLDSDQFEGPASNRNDDCDAGPGCVTARPLNPIPPATPTVLTVQDAGTGGVLEVTWLPNPEPDIKQYTIRYGSVPGVYPSTKNATASATSALLTGLADSVRYYIVMSATNTSGLESDPSAPVSGVPHLIQGIAPPKAISDLKLAPSGTDLILTWTQPTTDIYGRPTTVTGYRVYRGLTPGFQVTGSTPLATIGSGLTTTFTDFNALLDPAAFYYVVTAVDALGFVSGGGRELPNGVEDLAISMPSPDQIHLQWTPPTTDFQGLGTLIDHYQIHVTPAPAPRESLNGSTIVMDNVTVPSVDLNLPGSPRYISVIAVDNRGNLSPF